MTKLEKTIRGLECCIKRDPEDNLRCDACPYAWSTCVNRLKIDALELLKAKDIIVPTKWISVKDRLPTYAEVKNEQVLVLHEDGAIFSCGFDECIEGESIFGIWEQDFDPISLGATESYWVPLNGVTHWMPLPELPKEDKE